MGGSNSKLEKALLEFPAGERYFGFENFGNTCYANSVLQSLYFCRPFRDRLLQYAASLPKDAEDNLLTCLADLFVQIHTQKKKTGVLAPKRFVQRLKKDNELFRSYMHQDAHEFLYFLFNEISEVLEKSEKDKVAAVPRSKAASSLNGTTDSNEQQQQPKTWVHELFQGTMVNEMRCMQCETVTSREEAFYDLSLEIEHNSSVTSCLRNFSATETLDAEDKFSCDTCGCLQEAQKCIKIKQLPNILCLHLKRFKYVEDLQRLRKLMYRVVFPFELKLGNTSEGCDAADSVYNLFAVVVHIGSGMNHGHYVALVKSHDNWLFFDDEAVEPIPEAVVRTTFGSSQEYNSHMDHGYILMYERQQAEPAAQADGIS